MEHLPHANTLLASVFGVEIAVLPGPKSTRLRVDIKRNLIPKQAKEKIAHVNEDRCIVLWERYMYSTHMAQAGCILTP